MTIYDEDLPITGECEKVKPAHAPVEKVKPKERVWTDCKKCGRKTGNASGVCASCEPSEKVKPKLPDFAMSEEIDKAQMSEKVKPKCDRAHECEFGAGCVAPSIAKCPYGYGGADE